MSYSYGAQVIVLNEEGRITKAVSAFDVGTPVNIQSVEGQIEGGMFFVGTAGGALSSLLSAVLLTAVIVLGVAVTFAVTKLLSKTLLKGMPSSFTLELPPYRKPQIGKVIVRSICDRTFFVLGRAICVAAPAGLIIWLMNSGQTNQARRHIPARPTRHTTMVFHCSSSCFRLMTVPMMLLLCLKGDRTGNKD